MYNKIIIEGRLCRDPKIIDVAGKRKCEITIANNNSYEEAIFIDVDVWGKQIEVCEKYLKKGSHVIVDGRLIISSWTDKEGVKKSRTKILLSSVTFLMKEGKEEICERSEEEEIPF